MSRLPVRLLSQPLASRLMLEEREMRLKPEMDMMDYQRRNAVLPFTPPDLNLVRYFRNRRS